MRSARFSRSPYPERSWLHQVIKCEDCVKARAQERYAVSDLLRAEYHSAQLRCLLLLWCDSPAAKASWRPLKSRFVALSVELVGLFALLPAIESGYEEVPSLMTIDLRTFLRQTQKYTHMYVSSLYCRT